METHPATAECDRDDHGRGLGDRSVLAAARAAMLAERRAGCDLLIAAAEWAALHPSDSLLSPEQRLEEYGEDAVQYGGAGTPDVAETAAGTLGVEIGMNPAQARRLISDALDAQYRMPRLWDRVLAGRVRRDTVGRVTSWTRHLSQDQAADIDAQSSSSLSRLTPGQRLDNLIDGQIKRVDAEQLEKQAAESVHSRYVRKVRPDGNGMTDLYIHTTAADAEASMAAINALARILKTRHQTRGDLPVGVAVRDARTKDGGASGKDGTDCLDEWRAVAAQLLQTNPGLALQIQLQAHQPGLFDGVETLAAHTDPAGPAQDDTDDGHTRRRQAAIRAIINHLVNRIDLSKLQPTAFLHVHVTDRAFDGPFGPADPKARLARVEGIGAVYLDLIRGWLGEGCTVKLQPVVDTGDLPAVDRYEFTPAKREAMLSHSPASRFPWSNSLNRSNDLDHTVPYRPPDRGGPPGQTSTGNGEPLTRREHRYKTFGPIAVRQPQPDTNVWKTRYGRILVVNPTGTFDLGTGDFAHAVWAATSDLVEQPSLIEALMRRQLSLIS